MREAQQVDNFESQTTAQQVNGFSGDDGKGQKGPTRQLC